MLKTSPIGLVKNLSPSVDMTEDVEVGNSMDGDCDKTVKKLPSKDSNRVGYLTLDAKKSFNHLQHTFTKASIF